MDDDIQLPPLPPRPPVVDGDAAMINYGRACYKAGLVIGERRAKVDKVPVVHSATIWLHRGRVWLNDSYLPADGKQIDLRWTADGRVWINSERNCYAAKMLRRYGYYNAADALDGGER